MKYILIISFVIFLFNGSAFAEKNESSNKGQLVVNKNPKLEKYIKWYSERLGFFTGDPNEADDAGNTMVMYFIEKEAFDAAESLLNKGYDKTIKNKRGETAFDYGLRMGVSEEGLNLFRIGDKPSKYELSYDERNIVNKTALDINKLFMAKLAKQHCSYPTNIKKLNVDFNGDSKDDLVWFYSIPFCDGNQAVVNAAMFINKGNELYSEFKIIEISGTAGVDFKSIKLNRNKVTFTERYYTDNDPNCCPTGKRKQAYIIKNNDIKLIDKIMK